MMTINVMINDIFINHTESYWMMMSSYNGQGRDDVSVPRKIKEGNLKVRQHSYKRGFSTD